LPREDLLSAGFYNSCSETHRLREHNYPLLGVDKPYLEHNEDNYETIDHECDVEAFCTSCGTLLYSEPVSAGSFFGP